MVQYYDFNVFTNVNDLSTTKFYKSSLIIIYKMAVTAFNIYINILRHVDKIADCSYEYLHLIRFTYNFYLARSYVW